MIKVGRSLQYLTVTVPGDGGSNGGGDVIKVIASRVEDIPSLPEPVDVIVSEWMGFYLLHESMLDSVLVARDRFLRPETGIMLPSHAAIYAAPCSLDQYWKSKVRHFPSTLCWTATCSWGKFQPSKAMTVENKGILAITRPSAIICDQLEVPNGQGNYPFTYLMT